MHISSAAIFNKCPIVIVEWLCLRLMWAKYRPKWMPGRDREAADDQVDWIEQLCRNEKKCVTARCIWREPALPAVVSHPSSHTFQMIWISCSHRDSWIVRRSTHQLICIRSNNNEYDRVSTLHLPTPRPWPRPGSLTVRLRKHFWKSSKANVSIEKTKNEFR